MRTLLLSLFCLLCACSSPGNGSDGTDASSSTTDGATTSDVEGMAPDVSSPAPDLSSAPDTGGTTPTPDASMLPTDCVNNCLCESSCDHRCNITCRSECASGTCNFELNAGGYVTCRSGSTCTVSCESGGCEVICEPGATCTLTCSPKAVACVFKECSGERNSCSGRLETCGAPC